MESEAARGVVVDCVSLGARAHAAAVDVADDSSVAGLFTALDTHWPRADALGALVNCAGIVAPPSRVEDMDAARVACMLAVNVTGTFLCAGLAVRRMSSRHGGGGGVIDTMTVGLAKEVAGEGIRVVAVRPGLIETDIHVSGGQPDRLDRLRSQIPMQRVGQPDEVAATIEWLCSDAASYVTGAILDVSGGR